MSRRYLKTAKQALLVAAYLAFACKALVPIGYMPASLAHGSLLQLCDDVPGIAFAPHGQHHDHDHDHDHDKSDGAQWKHCQLGALASAAAFAVEFRFHLSWATQAQSSPVAVQSQAATVRIAYHSRAPPDRDSIQSA